MAMKLTIVSPENKLFEGNVDYVSLATFDGEIGILKNHAPLISRLGLGFIKYREENATELTSPFIIEEGFVKIKDNDILVLSHQVYTKDQIDVEKEKEKLEKIIQTKTISEQQFEDFSKTTDFIRKKIKLASK